MVGFLFFTTTTFLDIVHEQSSNHWQRLRVSSYRGLFFFQVTTNHTNHNGSTRWGSPSRPSLWTQSLITTVHGLVLIRQDIPTGQNLNLLAMSTVTYTYMSSQNCIQAHIHSTNTLLHINVYFLERLKGTHGWVLLTAVGSTFQELKK